LALFLRRARLFLAFLAMVVPFDPDVIEGGALEGIARRRHAPAA